MNAVEHLRAAIALMDDDVLHSQRSLGMLRHCRAALSLLEPAPLEWGFNDGWWKSGKWEICVTINGRFNVLGTPSVIFDSLAAAKFHCQSLNTAARDPLATVRRKVGELLIKAEKTRATFATNTTE